MEKEKTNTVTTDSTPNYPAESKKTKKSKRKYWKRKNSKVPVDTEEQDPGSVGDVTGTSSDNLESDNIEDDTETQEDDNLLDADANENDNDNISVANGERYSETNIKENEDDYFTNQFSKSLDSDTTDGCVIAKPKNFGHDNSNVELETQVSIEDTTVGENVFDGQIKSFPEPNPEFGTSPSSSFKEKFDDEPPDVQDSVPKGPIYNTKFLTKEKNTYEVETFQKNVMIIFNQIDIIGYEKRLGTMEDVNALTETFGKFGFQNNILPYHNQTHRQITEILTEFTQSDFTDFGCVAVVVLTHGKDRGYLMAKDIQYHESELINHFFDKHNQTLVTKPKIFIIQACRGIKVSQAALVGEYTFIQRDAARETHVYTLPTEADVLLLHSTFSGDASHRETVHGSWFIQTLCKHVNSLADTMDLESIMTEVKKDVAINKIHEVPNRRTGRTDMNKQIPVTMSTLIRKLYLTKPKNLIKTDEIGSPVKLSMVDAPLTNVTPVAENVRLIVPKQYFLHMRHALRTYHQHKQTTMKLGGFNSCLVLLNIANSIDENVTQEVTMEALAKEISEYLKIYAKEWDCYCMIQFCEC